MAGPYTAFTYGDPTVSGATAKTAEGPLFGYTAASNVYPVPVALVLPPATIGVAYSETISGVGGASPYTFAVISGLLPSGLSLNASTGVISGTATGSPATATFTVRTTDSHGVTGDLAFSLATVAATSGGASNYGYFA